MIEITRSLARQLKNVFRKLVPRSVPARPQVSFQTGKEGLCVRLHRAETLARFQQAGEFSPEEVIVPLDALGNFEGRGEAVVRLETTGPGAVCASWDHGGVPRLVNYQTESPANLSPYPALPKEVAAMTPGFLKVLAEASLSVAHDSIRFDTNNIQLKGSSGAVVATDGRQLLFQSGFTFPWAEDLLIPGSAVFAAKELPQGEPVTVGNNDTHLTLQVGSWTFHFPIDKAGRFPQVESVIPKEEQAGTRARLDPQDLECVAKAVSRLPGADDNYSPITLDLNGRVCVRAKADGQEQTVELALTRSQASGAAARVVLNRNYLARAARLGLSDLYVLDAKKPIVFQDEKRKFVVVPLIGAGAALPPAKSATRITSAQDSTENTEPEPKRRINAVDETPTNDTNASAPAPAPQPDSNGSHVSNGAKGTAATRTRKPKNTGLAALIDEAEALKNSLRDISSRAHKLVISLRRHRKQSRLVQSSLKALKDLQHIDA